MQNKKLLSSYLQKIIKENPKLAAGRKNYIQQQQRILHNLNLIKKYFLKQKNK